MKRWRFFRSVPNLLGLLIVGGFILVAVAAPLLAPPTDPDHPTPYRFIEGIGSPTPLEPQPGLPLGTIAYYATSLGLTDVLHFDIFYSLVWGTRAALRFGLITALTTASLGIIVGAVSGYVGGLFGSVTMRLTDAFLAFPIIAGVALFRSLMNMAGMETISSTYLALVNIAPTPFLRLVAALQLEPVMLTLILFSWVAYARITYSLISRLKQTEYAEAARSVGAGNLRLIFRHLIPNAIGPAIVLVARDVGGMVIQQAAFAFIGVSGTVNSSLMPEWSRVLIMGRHWVIGQLGNPLVYWWVYLPVTLALVLFGIGWNLLGDGLNTALNPRENGGRWRSAGMR